MSPEAKTSIAGGPHVGRWWHHLPSGRVQCDLCPHFCQLKPGQRGFCYVRQGSEAGVILTTYGRSSGFCIDPVEKKPLNHFYPGAGVLSFGTAGCNLGCQFCQNWDISKSREDDRLQSTASPEAIARAAKDRRCEAVAFTYNDPVIFAEYAIDTARACRELGVLSIAKSAGYVTAAARAELYGAMDAASIDLKGFTEKFYRKLCLGHLAPVLETIEFLKRETSVWLELVTLLIPGENDSSEEIASLCAWVSDKLGPEVPLHFTAFHPDFKLADKPVTPLSTLGRARDIALATGLRYVYTGNVTDPAGQTTWCPRCRHAVIARDRYHLLHYGIVNGACEECGEKIPGRFGSAPGKWGARRQAVLISN